jgi:hypothetical protein
MTGAETCGLSQILLGQLTGAETVSQILLGQLTGAETCGFGMIFGWALFVYCKRNIIDIL